MTALAAAGAIAERPRLLLTFDQAANALSCSGRQVRLLVQAGELASVHIGRLHRIALSDLEEFVRGLRASARRGGEE